MLKATQRIPIPRVRNPALALMLFVLGAYLLTMSGHTYSPDEETMLETARQLVTHGSWAIPSSHALVEVPGAGGKIYSQYGPGQAFAAVPWVGVGLLVGNLFPKNEQGFPLRLILASYNALIAAGIAGLLAAWGMLLGYSKKASLFLGATLAFCTFLWPHSRTFFSEPLTALLLLGSFYLMARTRYAPHEQSRWTGVQAQMLLSGALFAFALATKIQYVVALPAFLVYLFYITFHSRPTRQTFQHSLLILSWGVGLVLGLLLLLAYNFAAFGNPLLTGYGTDLKATFKTPLGEGVYGLLLSPGKGLLWYALPVLIAIAGVWRFARRFLAETVFILVLGVSIVTLFALYTFWAGDGSWGPRYLIPLLPFLLLPALPIFEAATRPTPHPLRVTHYALALVLSLGFFVNLMGVLVNFDTYINMGYSDDDRHFSLAASPILGHIGLLDTRTQLVGVSLGVVADSLSFKGGFSYSEGDKTKGELLPRWTTGQGTIQLWPDLSHGPAIITLRLSDNRPPSLLRATVSILLNNSPANPNAHLVPNSVSTDYTFSVGTRPATVIIQSDTWNPSKVGAGERNEDLGVRLEGINVTEGGQVRPYAMSNLSPAPPYYPQPRWYYDPSTPHPADLWPVYMLESGIGRKAMLALGLPVVLVALACLAVGVRGLRG